MCKEADNIYKKTLVLGLKKWWDSQVLRKFYYRKYFTIEKRLLKRL